MKRYTALAIAAAFCAVVSQSAAAVSPLASPVPTPSRWREMPRRAVLLVMGQSNAANHGEAGSAYVSRYPASVSVYCGGGVYQPARDPLCNADGVDGSPWLRLADRMIERGYLSVTVVPLAAGGTLTADWSAGRMSAPMRATAVDALTRGLAPTHVLWLQGESDAWNGIPGETTRANLAAIVGQLRAAGVAAPVHISTTSHCYRPMRYETREAQLYAADRLYNARRGPDTDALGEDMRYDGCHYTAAGLDRLAALWDEALHAHRHLMPSVVR